MSRHTGSRHDLTGERGNVPRQAWDLDDSDDYDQWVFTVSRMDSPMDLRRPSASSVPSSVLLRTTRLRRPSRSIMW